MYSSCDLDVLSLLSYDFMHEIDCSEGGEVKDVVMPLIWKAHRHSMSYYRVFLEVMVRKSKSLLLCWAVDIGKGLLSEGKVENALCYLSKLYWML